MSAQSDVRATILNLERDYASHKEKFEQWKQENAALCGHASYDKYVEQFLTWEKNVLDQLSELRKSSVNVRPHQAVAGTSSSSELPMVDLDTQLNDALQKVKPAEFMVAVFAMAQKDPDFLKKMFQVIHRETKGTGFYNAMIPQTAASTSPMPSVPSLYSTQQPIAVPRVYAHGSSMNQGFVGAAISAPSYNLNSAGNVYPQRSPYPSAVGGVRYTQMTPYGNIPESWTVQPPIQKHSKPPSPTREYQKTNVPYKDFSYGNSLL